jgi:Cys-tRNA(Pro)/Cys-tRNA(Cys) deacylase
MTPACLALDAAGVDYELHPYDHDPQSVSYGDEAVDALGVEPDRVFKTLMAELDTGELVVAIVPVSAKLDLKLLAAALGAKKAAMAAVRVAERSSGYVAGGISPFGQRMQRRTALDELAFASDAIFVSGGRRGLDLSVTPADLRAVLDATVAPLAVT